MKYPVIGIYNNPGSFSEGWIEYCQKKEITYQLVYPFSSTVIQDCEGLDAFMCHWNHIDFNSWLVSKQIVASLEFSGIYTFPNLRTYWHYDDKIAQKYLLEAVGAPTPVTWVFFDRDRATKWLHNEAEFPIVFKLRRGAASSNVKLIRTKQDAQKFCNKAFTKGFVSTPSYFFDLRKKLRKGYSIENIIKIIIRRAKTFGKFLSKKQQFNREKGYIYFQEFLPNNPYDTRVTIIGNRAFGVKRYNRQNDFRASASGLLDYDNIDLDLIKIAFDVAKKAQLQSAGFDFLYKNGNPVISEISYTFPAYMVHDSPGYWDPHLSWHPGHVRPQDAIIQDVVNSIRI